MLGLLKVAFHILAEAYGRTLLLVTVVAIVVQTAQAQPQQYYTGDGGKGIRLAVLELAGKGLSADEQWMLSLVQNSISGDFNKYSAMTIVDQQNLEKILEQWEKSMSGHYSDADRVKIGNLTNASHILTGSISKTANAFMLELTVTDVASGVRKASYSPTPISALALENLSAIKAASADLLRQLGVELTSVAQNELKQAANTIRLQAETAYARGIAAQRQGTEVAALSYFFQAAAFDSSLFEASKRSSVIAANISSGNIGADVRNDIVWRKSWIARLTETEVTFHSVINSVAPPYTLFYTAADIKTGNVNYQTETADLSIPINLSANVSWFNAMNRSLKAADAVLEGLNTTKRKNDWGLSNWPWNGVSKTNPFASPKRYDFTVVFELVNEQGQAIGSQTVRLSPSFGIIRNNNNQFAIQFTENSASTVNFNGVKADNISDKLTVRVASVNGEPPQNAQFAISAFSSKERQQSTFLRIENGVVLGFDGSLSSEQRAQHRKLVIPKEAWGKPVTAIGDRAFANEQLTGVTIPNSITSIGKEAFANNQIAGMLTIPNSVTSIGNQAFANNQIASITIPNKITSIGSVFFGNELGLIHLNNSGDYIDARDGQKYRLVKIGTQTWMAQNLNYQPQIDNYVCDNCNNKDGIRYDWNTAKNVCPSGWHLPSSNEWLTLFEFANDKKSTTWSSKTAANNLKSKDWNGIDMFGFSAMRGGSMWWTASKLSCDNNNCANSVTVRDKSVEDYSPTITRSPLFVRCIGSVEMSSGQTNRMNATTTQGQNRPLELIMLTIDKYEKLLEGCSVKKSDLCANVMYTLGSFYADQANYEHLASPKRTGPDYSKSLDMYRRLIREYPSFQKLPDVRKRMAQMESQAGSAK